MIRRYIGVGLAGVLLGAAGCAYDEMQRQENLDLKQTPLVVRRSFEREHPGVKARDVEKRTFADGTVEYQVHYAGQGERRGVARFDSAGQTLDQAAP